MALFFRKSLTRLSDNLSSAYNETSNSGRIRCFLFGKNFEFCDKINLEYLGGNWMEIQNSKPAKKRVYVLIILSFAIIFFLNWREVSSPPPLIVGDHFHPVTASVREYEWPKVAGLALKSFDSKSSGIFMDIVQVRPQETLPLYFEVPPKSISVHLENSKEKLSFVKNTFDIKLPDLSPGIFKLVINAEWTTGEVKYWVKVKVVE